MKGTSFRRQPSLALQGVVQASWWRPLPDKKLKPKLESFDFTYKRVRTGSVWQGVNLRLTESCLG